MWLDAADPTTLFSDSSGTTKANTGGTVQFWKDKSTSSNNCTQASQGNAPTLSTISSNLPSLSIPTSNIQLVSQANISLLNTAPKTLITVMYVPNTTVTVSVNFGGTTALQSFMNGFETSLIWCPAMYNTDNYIAPVPANCIGIPTVIYSTYTGTQAIGYANFTNTATTSAILQTTATPLYIGKRQDGHVSAGGYLSEVIIFNTSLTLPQQQQVESYLAQKWGLRQQLPQGHPGTRGIVYPQTSLQNWVPWRYPSTFVPTTAGTCTLWLDGADPAGNGIIPSNNATVSTWVDKSGNGNTGSGNGTYSSSTSNIVFNNSSYSLPTGTFISGSGSYTIVSIQSTNNAGGIEYFFSFGSLGAPQHLSFPHVSPNPYLSWYGNDYNFTYSMTSGRSFIAINSYNVSSNFKYGYVNGNFDGSLAPSSGRNTGTSPNTLGIGPNGYNLNGTISELLIYPSFLDTGPRQQVEGYLAWKWGLQSYLPANHPYKNSSPNITNPGGVSRPANLPVPPITIYAGPRPPTYVTSGLLFYLDAGNATSYPGSGSTWTDLAGSGLTTTLYNSPTYSSANGGYLAFVPGSSQYGQTSASLATLSSWSLEVWHYYTATNTGSLPCIITEVWSSTPINFTLGSGSGSTSSLQVGYYNNGWFTTTGSYSLPSVGWYHIVGTYDGANLKLYVNNVLTQTSASTTASVSSALGIRFMRRWDSPEYWGGYLAIIRIYNRALSATEVTTNYAASKARFGLS